MFGLFKKTDPVCGMKQEKGKGIEKYGQWFCSKGDLEKYEAKLKSGGHSKHDCCH